MAGKLIQDLTEGSVFKKLTRFALPLMLANGLQTVYNMVDSVIVGRFVGAAGLSAVTTSGEIMTMFMLVSIGFSGAGQTVIAQYVGRREYGKIKNAIRTLLALLFLIGAAVTVVGLMTVRWQLRVVNLPEEAVGQGVAYLRTCLCGVLFIYGYNALAASLRGLGDSKGPLYCVVISSLVNIALDLLFVGVFRWEAFGAAFATVIGQGVSFAVALYYLYRRRDQIGLRFRLTELRADGENLRLLSKIGVPQAIQLVTILLSMLFIVSRVNRFGLAASTVNGVATKLGNVCRIITDSMGTATAAMIAQCFGAGLIGRCRKTVRCTLLIGACYCGACALVIALFPRQVFSVFTADPAVLDYSQLYALAGAASAMSLCIRAAFNNVIGGIGNAKLLLAIALVDGVLARIGFSLLFGEALGHGLVGYWWGNCLAGYVSVLLGVIYYFSGAWKSFRLMKTPAPAAEEA